MLLILEIQFGEIRQGTEIVIITGIKIEIDHGRGTEIDTTKEAPRGQNKRKESIKIEVNQEAGKKEGRKRKRTDPNREVIEERTQNKDQEKTIKRRVTEAKAETVITEADLAMIRRRSIDIDLRYSNESD